MSRLLLQGLCLASMYLFDATGLADLYQLYCVLLHEFGIPDPRVGNRD